MARQCHRFRLMISLAVALSFWAGAWAPAGPAPARAAAAPGAGNPQTPSSGAPAQPQNPSPTLDRGFPISMTSKQKRDLLKGRFENMKKQADELADLSKSLQDDLNKSNEKVLSLKVLETAEKIEKLAKKIKDAARGY